MILDWNTEKNKIVQEKTGISFEDIENALVSGNLLDDVQHHNTERYGHQRILIVNIDNYAYAVPYVRQDDGTFFLKTLYPTRNYSLKYLSNSRKP